MPTSVFLFCFLSFLTVVIVCFGCELGRQMRASLCKRACQLDDLARQSIAQAEASMNMSNLLLDLLRDRQEGDDYGGDDDYGDAPHGSISGEWCCGATDQCVYTTAPAAECDDYLDEFIQSQQRPRDVDYDEIVDCCSSISSSAAASPVAPPVDDASSAAAAANGATTTAEEDEEVAQQQPAAKKPRRIRKPKNKYDAAAAMDDLAMGCE